MQTRSVTLCPELIVCFVPEALPLNHSLQSHCGSLETERGHQGERTKEYEERMMKYRESGLYRRKTIKKYNTTFFNRYMLPSVF